MKRENQSLISGAGPIALLKIAFLAGHGHGVLKTFELASGWKFQAVAGSIDRFDEAWLAWVWLELGAQMTNVNPDGFDVVIGFIPPHFLEDQRWGHGLAMPLQKTVQKFEFEVCQSDGTVEPDGFEAFRDQGEWSVTQDFVVIAGSNGSSIAATQQSLHAGL